MGTQEGIGALRNAYMGDRMPRTFKRLYGSKADRARARGDTTLLDGPDAFSLCILNAATTGIMQQIAGFYIVQHSIC